MCAAAHRGQTAIYWKKYSRAMRYVTRNLRHRCGDFIPRFLSGCWATRRRSSHPANPCAGVRSHFPQLSRFAREEARLCISRKRAGPGHKKTRFISSKRWPLKLRRLRPRVSCALLRAGFSHARRCRNLCCFQCGTFASHFSSACAAFPLRLP